MIICSHCSTQNLEGLFFCEECGSPLTGLDIRKTTTNLATQNLSSSPSASNANIPLSGTIVLTAETTVIIHFKDSDNRVTLQTQAETVIGRTDEKRQSYPDLDLTSYGALEHGVSRLHAAIRRSEDKLILVDLDSANGTYLNGKQLPPNQPHILRDGDELRFGKLVSHVYFKQQ
jgi:pSer/pThr/pTyr-binding forkhead associated (FHA) protein